MAKAARKRDYSAVRKRGRPKKSGSPLLGIKPTKSRAKKPAAPRRPPEVSAADWKKWSPSYRKRAAGFYKLHPGAPRYRMRGKGTGEHLTLAQRREERIEAFADRQSYRGELKGADDAGTIADKWRAVIRDHGWSEFNAIERAVRERQKGQGKITTAELGFDWDWDDYDIEDSELFYN